MRKGDQLRRPGLFRWHSDPEQASTCYERAAVAYGAAEAYEEAAEVKEKQGDAMEEAGDPWAAGYSYEEAMKQAKAGSLGADRVKELGKRAAAMYGEAGKLPAAARALQRAASALSEDDARQAAELHGLASDYLEQDERPHEALDPKRAQAKLLASIGDHSGASSALMHLASLAEAADTPHAMAQAYLSAVVTLLHKGDAKEAYHTLEAAREVQSFEGSAEFRAAEELLDAFRQGGEGVQNAVKSFACFKHLEQQFARMALQLPSQGSDLGSMSRDLGGAHNDQEPLPVAETGEPDLT